MIDTQRQEGLVFYELAVSTDETRQSAVVNRVKETYGEKLWSTQTSNSGVLLMNLFGFTLGEPEEAAMKLVGMEGTKWCTVLTLKEVIEPLRPNWIDALISEKIALGASA